MHPPEASDHIPAGHFTITVLGLGHIGLPTALGFAELGWSVVGADTDTAKVALIKQGQSPFFEPGLQELLLKHSNNRKLAFTDDVESAIRKGTVIFLCVGTPQRENGESDLTAIEALARTISRNLSGYKLIVEKSTVPAITGQWIRKVIERHSTNARCAWDITGTSSFNGHGPEIFGIDLTTTSVFDVASNPEFLQEGKAVEDFFKPERIVCGVMSGIARDLMGELYQSMQCPLVFTDVTTAELIKHAANAFLATKISFINMLADVCEAVDADITKVAVGLGLDSRIGPKFLNAGLGFGGYCLPKDLRAFIHLAEEHNVKCGLLHQTELINQERVDRLIRKVREPSLHVIEKLQKLGARLRIYDPKAMAYAQQIMPEEAGKLTYCRSAYDAADGADSVIVLTEWHEFRQLDLARLRKNMQTGIMIDGRNIYDPEKLQDAGFEYLSMGRRTILPSAAPVPRPPKRSSPVVMPQQPSAGMPLSAAGDD